MPPPNKAQYSPANNANRNWSSDGSYKGYPSPNARENNLYDQRQHMGWPHPAEKRNIDYADDDAALEQAMNEAEREEMKQAPPQETGPVTPEQSSILQMLMEFLASKGIK